MAHLAPLPERVTALWFALEQLPLPPELRMVGETVMGALGATNPTGAFALGVRRIRNKGATWVALNAFLQREDIVQAAEQAGASGSRLAWLEALAKIQAGEKATDAFGLFKPGRRHAKGFSSVENVASYVEHQVRRGAAVEQVLAHVRVALKSRMPDDRSIRSARRRLSGMSDDDVNDMAATAQQIEGIP